MIIYYHYLICRLMLVAQAVVSRSAILRSAESAGPAISRRGVVVVCERGKYGKLQTRCCGDESLPELLVESIVSARWRDGSEPQASSSWIFFIKKYNPN